jgi:hypothetical protein
MPASTVQSFLGISKETVRGTGTTAADYLPVKSLQLHDHQTFLQDTGIRGSQVDNYGQVSGVTWAEYDFAGDVFADTIGYPLAGVLGQVATTGASAPYTHAIALLNSGDGQPGSYSLSDYDGLQARQMTAAQFSELSFTFNADGLLGYTAKAVGNISATISTPTRSYTSVAPVANWRGAVTVGGVASTILLDGTCDIKRPVSPIHTIDGSANPYRFWAGPVQVSGKLSFVTESGEAELLRYLNNSQPSMDLDFSQGAGASATQVKLHMTTCAYTDAQVTRGKDWIQTDVTYEAVANTTDVGASGGYGPIVVTLKNAKASGTFA